MDKIYFSEEQKKFREKTGYEPCYVLLNNDWVEYTEIVLTKEDRFSAYEDSIVVCEIPNNQSIVIKNGLNGISFNI